MIILVLFTMWNIIYSFIYGDRKLILLAMAATSIGGVIFMTVIYIKTIKFHNS